MRIAEAVNVFGLASGEGLDDAKAKAIYRELCKAHHPDVGGSVQMMALVNDAYDTIKRAIAEGYIGEIKAAEYDLPAQLQAIVNALAALDGVEMELCGTWLWIAGETKAHKDALKAAGCRWAPKKKRWYWRPEGQKRRRKGNPVSMEKIRARYGSQTVRSGMRERESETVQAALR